MSSFDADFAIIGSGFGGSVCALRLSEKGYRAVVLEQGRRVRPEDMEAAGRSMRRFLWLPRLGMDGYFSQVFLQHVTIARGVAVGGGSIVYAAVLLEPRDAFYEDPTWSRLGMDWRAELRPHYATARRMLGVRDCPTHGRMDDYLRAAAASMGDQARRTFGPTPLGIHFAEDTEPRPDPFFGGAGPERAGCRLCGKCLGGCPYGSKNSLDQNYLHLAEGLGAQIRPLHRVDRIEPLPGGGYRVEATDPLARIAHPSLRVRNVILAAGVIGTLQLLFRNRDYHQTLPALSSKLGQVVRTNSEAIVAISSKDPDEDLTGGPAISSHFYPNAHTHITNNRFPPAFEFLKLQAGPLVDGGNRAIRALKTLAHYALHPMSSTFALRSRQWHRSVSALTVMQDLDNQLRLESAWGGRALRSRPVPGSPAPSYVPEANEAARAFARASGGIPGNGLLESLLGTSTTAHILGGAPMGRAVDEGVLDAGHEVFGYPGLYVVDGSSISANVGVNPSLTITAMAERFAASIPAAEHARS